MATRITTIGEFNKKKQEFFYKTVSKNIIYATQSRKLTECRLDVDIKNKNDIDVIRKFLDSLECSL